MDREGGDEQATAVFRELRGDKSLFVLYKALGDSHAGVQHWVTSTGKALLGIWTTGICRGIERKHSHHKDIRREDAAFGCICPMRHRDGEAYLLT